MGYVLSLEATTRVVKELKRNNKIVYTHGAYDLFHAGHLDFLKKSKERGKILVVGVDTDETISSYKNVARPVIQLKERIEIISKLDFVDFVFPLQMLPELSSQVSKENPSEYYLSLYKKINPSLVTYGRGYAGKQTINKARNELNKIKFMRILDKYGGQRSTTGIINKILSSQNS